MTLYFAFQHIDQFVHRDALHLETSLYFKYLIGLLFVVCTCKALRWWDIRTNCPILNLKNLFVFSFLTFISFGDQLQRLKLFNKPSSDEFLKAVIILILQPFPYFIFYGYRYHYYLHLSKLDVFCVHLGRQLVWMHYNIYLTRRFLPDSCYWKWIRISKASLILLSICCFSWLFSNHQSQIERFPNFLYHVLGNV